MVRDIAFGITRALSYKQPWGTAVAKGIKPIENRSWGNQADFSEWLALHVSAKEIDKDLDWGPLAGTELQEKEDELPFSQIIGIHKISHVISAEEAKQNPTWTIWVSGPYCLVVEQAYMLKHPITCPGALGRWVITDDIRAKLMKSEIVE